jgi:hypothetical protein
MCWAWAALSGLNRKALLPRKRKIIFTGEEVFERIVALLT